MCKCKLLIFFRRYVITAAHCYDNNLAEVILGAHDLNVDPSCEDCAPRQKFSITHWDFLSHEDYTPPNFKRNSIYTNNDIALIRLPRLARTILEDFTFKVLPICLAWNPR